MVNNSQGLHLRPADLIVRLAKKYESKIELTRENHRVNGRSITDLITLAAEQGTTLVIEAEGPDAQQAVEALAELFASNFAENEPDQNQSTPS